MPGMTGANQPEPAILGRPEDEIVRAYQTQGAGDVRGPERRNVGAD